MRERETELEELLAHQQRLLDQLNSVVTEQGAELHKLRREFEALRVVALRLTEQVNAGSPNLPHEKPPHY